MLPLRCESIGRSVGAVPFHSWLSCVRNLVKGKNKKSLRWNRKCKRRYESIKISSFGFKMDWDRLGEQVATSYFVCDEGVWWHDIPVLERVDRELLERDEALAASTLFWSWNEKESSKRRKEKHDMIMDQWNWCPWQCLIRKCRKRRPHNAMRQNKKKQRQ